MARKKIAVLVNPASRIAEKIITTTGMRPGELVQGGTSDTKWARGASAAAAVPAIFLLEDSLQGKTTSDTFTAGDVAKGLFALPGDEVDAWIKDGQTIVIGDILDAAGALGELQKATAGTTKKVLGEALEAVTTSGAAARILIRVW